MSLFAETLGGLANIFPATQTESKKSPRDIVSDAASPETTTVAEILAARNITLGDTTTPFTTKATTTPSSTATTTILPAVSTGTYTVDSSGYTISGIIVSTLALSSSTTTTTAATTTATSTSAPSVVTADSSISDWMLEPREEQGSPYDVAVQRLRQLPNNPTYDELFTYIFDDCLLFRKVIYLSSSDDSRL